MWFVLGGDTWCNLVTSLHEENPPMFRMRYEKVCFYFLFFSVAERCLNHCIWDSMIITKMIILATLYCNHIYCTYGIVYQHLHQFTNYSK